MTTGSCFDFLEMETIPTLTEAKEAFLYSNAFLWLYNIVDKSPDKKCSFGKLSQTLHDVLINDPKPYRKEVKDLLGNLLGWIESLKIEKIVIDVPNHSQLVRVR